MILDVDYMLEVVASWTPQTQSHRVACNTILLCYSRVHQPDKHTAAPHMPAQQQPKNLSYASELHFQSQGFGAIMFSGRTH